MPDQPVASNENLILAAQDHGAALGADGAPFEAPADGKPSAVPADGESNEPLPVTGDGTEVGLTQKGTSEDAVIRRETDI